MLIHSDIHDDDVIRVLGLKKPDNKERLVGIEIETAWTSQARRTAFLKELEVRGLTDCISKHDGSVGERGETWSSEIVSAPMPLEKVKAFAKTVGRVIESRADKGLVTKNAGVHLHLSEAWFNDDALWRYAAAICQNRNAFQRWGIKPDAQVLRLSDKLNDFWDAVALRPENAHSLRKPYNRLDSIPRTVSHSLAFIHGRSTPTYETRIFRTPKSCRVLASYVDAVASLLSFSTAAQRDLVLPPPVKVELPDNLAPELRVTRMFDGRVIAWRIDNGERVSTEGLQHVGHPVTGAMLFFPARNDPNFKGKRLPTPEELMGADGIGASGWATGTLPLPEYIKYVFDHAEAFPDLAKRLDYDKFAVFRGLDAPEVDLSGEPHLEFRPGCRVRVEANKRGEVYVLSRPTTKGRPGGGLLPSWEMYAQDRAWDSTVYETHALIHACKGALEVGGEV